MLHNTTLEKIEGLIRKTFITKLCISGREIDVNPIDTIDVNTDSITIHLNNNENIEIQDIILVLYNLSETIITIFGNDGDVMDITLSLK